MERAELPQEVGHWPLAELRDDEGTRLLPTPRVWHNRLDTDLDRLKFWAVSVPVVAYMATRGRAFEECIQRELPALTRINEACCVARRWRDAANDPACPEPTVERVATRLEAAQDELKLALAPILEHGLEQRMHFPLALGDGRHRAVFEWFRGLGVETPDGISVCERCSIVFRTARKAEAASCPACNKKKKAVALITARANDRGGQTLNFFGITVRWHECPVCGIRFDTERAHTIYCSDAHRKLAKRRVKRGVPVRHARGRYWTPNEALDLGHLEVCIDCGVDYLVTTDPERLRCASCFLLSIAAPATSPTATSTRTGPVG